MTIEQSMIVEPENINQSTVFCEPRFTKEAFFNRFCRFRTVPGMISKQFEKFLWHVKQQKGLNDRPDVFLFPDDFNEQHFNMS